MRREILRGLGGGWLLLALLLGCGASSAVDPKSTAGNQVLPEQMVGVDFSGLTEAQKMVAASLLNDRPCDCGCGMTLGVCRRDDSTCSKSLGLATRVVALAKQGKTYQEIQFALDSSARVAQQQAQRPAQKPKFVEFPIPAGDAPFIGPENAKVTILHYLDYQ